jgi:hypothetical protein
MTTFVHPTFAQEHAGVIRAQQAAQTIGQYAYTFTAQFSSTRATASLLLAAVASALVVAANQLIDNWTEGHLMAAWLVLWTVAFATMALLGTPLRQLVTRVKSQSMRFAQDRREAAADADLWRIALTDARVMADISRAMAADAATDVRSYR